MMTKLTPTEQQLDQLAEAGYGQFSPGLHWPGQTIAACDDWRGKGGCLIDE
jgi:hypothetical protein